MNNSERLLSAFSEDYFFKELVFDDLCFVPEGGTKIELADLIINLKDIIIAIQLKERNPEEQTFDDKSENKWLQNKCKVAKKQVKQTMQLLSSGELPAFKNKRGQEISFQLDAKVIPLVVFENQHIDKYPHLLKRHSDNSIDVNCMSFEDYVEMCKTLISPIEIVAYLEYRQRIYKDNSEIDIMIFDGVGDELIITKPMRQESLVMQFLAEVYGVGKAEKQNPALQYFRSFLHKLPEHTKSTYIEKDTYSILLFLAHMNRQEMDAFWDNLIATKEENEKGIKGILHSLRRGDNEFAVLFISGIIRPIDEILPIVRKTAEVKRILEVAIYHVSAKEFAIDFLYWDNTQDS